MTRKRIAKSIEFWTNESETAERNMFGVRRPGQADQEHVSAPRFVLRSPKLNMATAQIRIHVEAKM